MAAAFARAMGEGRVEVGSAGSAPAAALHPVVVEAMREVGIDLSGERPRRLDDASIRAADVVVTMGCGDACPVVPGKRREDWALDDPAGKPLARVREVRDEVRARVRRLLGELGVLEPTDLDESGRPPAS
jgi:arsenate reductase